MLHEVTSLYVRVTAVVPLLLHGHKSDMQRGRVMSLYANPPIIQLALVSALIKGKPMAGTDHTVG